MKQNYLLPHGFKRVGLIMLVPFLAACIWLLCGPCEGEWFTVDVPALFTLDLAFMYFAFASVFVCFIMYICKFNYEIIKIRRTENEK